MIGKMERRTIIIGSEASILGTDLNARVLLRRTMDPDSEQRRIGIPIRLTEMTQKIQSRLEMA